MKRKWIPGSYPHDYSKYLFTIYCLKALDANNTDAAPGIDLYNRGNKEQQQSKQWQFAQATECGGCRRFLVVLLHLVCFYPEWDKEGGGRLVWGKGQEEERRSKGGGGDREGREAETKGKVW